MTDGPPQGQGTAAPASPELEPAASGERAGFAAVLRYFLRLGTSGFGRPIAVVGYMQRDLVEQRGWIAGEDFLNGVAHRGTQCTFEVLIDEYHLASEPGLARLAAMVHAADIRADLGTDPLALGLLAIGGGGLDAEPDDQRLLERGSFVYDALYAWCRRQSGTSPPAT